MINILHSYFEENKEEMFPLFFSKQFRKFDLQLGDIVGGIDKNVYNNLYYKLFNLAIRTLIIELHTYKFNDLLEGNDTFERYKSFEYISGTDEFEEYFNNKYPVLISKLNIIIENSSKYVREINSNFYDNLDLIKNAFGNNIENIVSMNIGKGDTHNGGKSVAIIQTNSKTIVYKPHGLGCDIVLKGIIDWLNSLNESLNLKTVKFIDCQKYGWQEFVTYEGDLSIIEAQRYYYKCGVFLALFYVLGSTDMHFENVIVNRDCPYFIDLETLLEVNRNKAGSNVLKTNFIPNIQNDIVYDFDLSGLCGKGNSKSKIKTISIINPKTDEMRIENVEGIVKANFNIVYVNDEIAKIENYRNQVIDGFRYTMHIINKNKQEFKNIVDAYLMKYEIDFRCVLRATQVYGKYLTAATHPDYLKDYSKQQELFNRLIAGVEKKSEKARIASEIKSLLSSEVPYFYVNYKDTTLFSYNGTEINDYFDESLQIGLHKRVDEINNNVIEKQVYIIDKSLLGAYNEQVNLANTLGCHLINGDYPNIIAKKIMDNIISDEFGSFLIINTLINGRFKLSILNTDLYEGGGIIWFLACYGKLHNDNLYMNTAVKLLNTLVAYQNYKNQNLLINRLSAFSGIGSLIYLYYNLHHIIQDSELETKYNDSICQIESYDLSFLDQNEEFDKYDFICGISGLIVLLSNIYVQKENDRLKNVICNLHKKLVKFIKSNSINEIGLAHGASGYAYALFKVMKIFGYVDEISIIQELLKKEMDNFRLQHNKSLSWCKGITGLLLIRAKMYEYNKKLVDKKDIIYLYESIKNVNIPTVNGLCHGTRGIKEGIQYTKNILKDENAECYFNLLADKIRELDGFGITNNVCIENFMNGSSGVAYSHLTEEYGNLPSVLLLEVFNGDK